MDTDPTTTERAGGSSDVVVEAVSWASGTDTGREKSTRISTSSLYPKGPAWGNDEKNEARAQEWNAG